MENVPAIDFFVICKLEKGCDYFISLTKWDPTLRQPWSLRLAGSGWEEQKKRKHYRFQKKHQTGVPRFTQSSHITNTCIYRPDKFWVIICLIKCAMRVFFFFFLIVHSWDALLEKFDQELYQMYFCCCLVAKLCPTLQPHPWTAACQASLSFTISQSLLKLLSFESVMPSNHLILCHSPLLLPSVFPSIKVFSASQLFAWGGLSTGVYVCVSCSVMSDYLQSHGL